jgi:hypothetical protein
MLTILQYMPDLLLTRIRKMGQDHHMTLKKEVKQKTEKSSPHQGKEWKQ